MEERNVLHIIGRLIPGGVELRTLELIQATAPDKTNHYVCVTSGQKGTLDKAYLNAGAELNYLDIKSPMFPLRLYRFLRTHPIDAVHSNLMYVSGYILYIARLAGVTVRIAHFQSDGVGESTLTKAKKIQRKFLKSLIDNYATKIVGLTPSNLDIAWNSDWRKDRRCLVVPNGVPVDTISKVNLEEFNIPDDATVVIHVGRGELATKNRPKAISAFSAYFHEHNKNSYLLFVGRDGITDSQSEANRSEWARIAKKEKVFNNVFFLGHRDDVRALLNSADIFLLTSTLEGLPGVLLEALAAGLPVVSSNLPGAKFLKEEFPAIGLLDPEQSDRDWGIVLNKCPRKLSPDRRESLVNDFRSSQFEFSRAKERYLRLWRE